MEQVDLTLKMPVDSRLRSKLGPLVHKLAKDCHFDKMELMCVLIMHYKICQDRPMGRKMFRDVMSQMFNIPNEEMIERMYAAIEAPNSPGIGADVWARLLAMFFRGTLDEKILYCFTVYDNLNMGYITRSEMVKLLKQTILAKKQDAEDTAADLSDMLIRKLDLDRDGKISFRDYRESVRLNPELLQPFGQCLPDREICISVMSLFTNFVSTMHFNYLEQKYTMSEFELNVYQRRKFSAS